MEVTKSKIHIIWVTKMLQLFVSCQELGILVQDLIGSGSKNFVKGRVKNNCRPLVQNCKHFSKCVVIWANPKHMHELLAKCDTCDSIL